MTSSRISITLLAAGFFSIAANAQIGNNDSVLNPNVADEAELAALANLAASLVEAIVEQRPFASMLEVDEILAGSLIEDQRQALYAQLYLPINLNSASGLEMLLIPGMTNRMAHEFDEYRPYTTMEQFRREIGKYVDDAEVARLEQYVFVPLDLNSATSEEFAAIPGASRRMVHEFEEYRPYENMEQFRREIGKYVDEAEVARFERYMTIR